MTSDSPAGNGRLRTCMSFTGVLTSVLFTSAGISMPPSSSAAQATSVSATTSSVAISHRPGSFLRLLANSIAQAIFCACQSCA